MTVGKLANASTWFETFYDGTKSTIGLLAASTRIGNNIYPKLERILGKYVFEVHMYLLVHI